MKLVPIPTTHEAICRTAKHWTPFLPKISLRSKEPVEVLVDQVFQGLTHIALFWDEDAKAARALLGIQFFFRGDDKIGQLVWLTGTGMKDWTHLLADIEQYLREKCECTEIKPVCRPGWSRLLKQHGYRMTHVVMEKTL